MPAFPMARAGAGSVLCSRNSKLDSFLKRNTDRGVYERIRAYEPCVVISETVNKVFMHVVLSDDCVYLAEYPPRTLTEAVSFGDIRDIELVNDIPDFLSGRDRERSQHIRVVYAAPKHSGKRDGWLKEHLLSPMPPSLEGVSGAVMSTHSAPPETDSWRLSPVTLRGGEEGRDGVRKLRTTRSASCPDTRLALPQPLPLLPPSPVLSEHTPLSPVSPLLLRLPTGHRLSEAGQVPRRRRSVFARLLKRGGGGERDGGEGERDGGEGEREAELHLYAVSPTSRIYLHLQSSWNSFIIRTTLLLDPLYRRRCSVVSSASPQKQPTISWERTAHLFRQLSGELLLEGISLESLYLLLQELRTAAHRNATLRKLFWRSSDMFPFLVRTLEDSLQSCQRPEPKGHTADQLLLCTLIAQTLALMFRETEIEPARLNMLTAKQGALTASLLLALVCDPEAQPQTQTQPQTQPQTQGSVWSVSSPGPGQGSVCSSPGPGQGSPPHTELQGLLAEYQDAACSLLFELVVLCQEACRTPSLEHFLTVGWVLKVLQPHPYLLSFVGYQTRQVVLVLSGPQAPLSPAQAALLYQRCRVLLACLQYSSPLGQHLRTEFREEFRYYVSLSCVEEKLPPRYPISQPTQRLVSQLLGLILQGP